MEWISGRVPSGGFTLSGSVSVRIRARESNIAANCGGRIRLYKRTSGGTLTELTGSPWNDGVEFTTSDAAYDWSFTPTSMSFAEDDRLVIRLYITNVGTMGGSRTCTLTYDGASGGAAGDTFVTITENVTFKAENFPLVAATASYAVTAQSAGFRYFPAGFPHVAWAVATDDGGGGLADYEGVGTNGVYEVDDCIVLISTSFASGVTADELIPADFTSLIEDGTDGFAFAISYARVTDLLAIPDETGSAETPEQVIYLVMRGVDWTRPPEGTNTFTVGAGTPNPPNHVASAGSDKIAWLEVGHILQMIPPVGSASYEQIVVATTSSFYMLGAAVRYFEAGSENPGAMSASDLGFGANNAATLAFYPASATVSYSLEADAASYAISMQTANLRAARKLAAATVAYSVTVSSAALNRGQKLALASASYAVTNTNATFRRTLKLAAASATFAITATAATLTSARLMAADTTNYSIGTADALLKPARKLAAATVGYAIGVQDATLTRAFKLIAAPTTYEIAAQDAIARATLLFRADTVTYAIDMSTVGLVKRDSAGWAQEEQNEAAWQGEVAVADTWTKQDAETKAWTKGDPVSKSWTKQSSTAKSWNSE